MKHLVLGLLAVLALTSCNDKKAPAAPVKVNDPVETPPVVTAPVAPVPPALIWEDESRASFGGATFVHALSRTMQGPKKFAMSENDQKKANNRWSTNAIRLKFNGSLTDQKAVEFATEASEYDHKKGFALFNLNKVIYTLDMKKWYTLSKGYAEKGELLLNGVAVGTYMTYAQDIYETPMRKSYLVVIQDLCTNEYADSCDLNSHKMGFTKDKLVVIRDNGRTDERQGSIHVYSNDQHNYLVWKNNIDSKMADLRTKLETFSDDLEDVTERLDRVFNQIKDLDGKLKTKADAAAITAQVDNQVKAEFKKLVDAKVIADKAMVEAKMDTDKFQQEKTAFDKQITSLKEKIAALQTTIDRLSKEADKKPEVVPPPKKKSPKVPGS